MLSAKVCDPEERISLSVPAPPSIVSEFAAVEVLTVKVSSCPLPVSVSADALPIKLKPPVPVALATLMVPPDVLAVKLTLAAEPKFFVLLVASNEDILLAFAVAPLALIIISVV